MTRLDADIRFAELGDQELVEQLRRLFWDKAEPETGSRAVELSSLSLNSSVRVYRINWEETDDITRHAHELRLLLIPLAAHLTVGDHTLRSPGAILAKRQTRCLVAY
jgi:hypothetical protein